MQRVFYVVACLVLQWLLCDHLLRDPAVGDAVFGTLLANGVTMVAGTLALLLGATLFVVLVVSWAMVFARAVTAPPRAGLH